MLKCAKHVYAYYATENLVIHADVEHTWDWRDDAGDEK